MSYPYTPPTGAQPPPTPTTYPYSAYSAYSQTPGAYSYQASAYQTGVTGYAWTYPYSYLAHHAQSMHAQGAAPTPAPAPVTAHTPSNTLPPPPPHRTSTLSSYTPTYMRDSAPSAAGRGSRRQANYRGLFAKELKSLMYGFGDDRNPATDTVNVMEEILVEYITDVCQSAGASSRKARLSIEDLRRALSRPADAKKLARMEELLFMQEDIKRARAQFLEPDTHNPNDY